MPNITATRTPVLTIMTLICLLLGGCSQVGKEFSSYDRFTHSGFEGVRVKDMGLPGVYAPFTAQLDLIRFRDPGKKSRFVFRTRIATTDDNIWADKIVWIADGHRIEMSGTSKLSDVRVSRYGTVYYESALFVATPSQLNKLADSQTISFRIYGARGKGPGCDLQQESLQAIRMFCNRHLFN